MSYFQKYRPQTIQHLDLTVVREMFLQILSQGAFSQAYLFTGPKGTGKTSLARILAQVLNCTHNRKALEQYRETGKPQPLSEPCGECESCKGIRVGSSMAVMEIDAASNRGIDDIRVLRERVGLAPSGGLYSVYVIDEVHMLTTEAFNALLKTLEEPPKHVVFLLCTTEAQKIPATVLSRLTRVAFSRASVTEMVSSLGKAVEGEKLTIEDDLLEMIAEASDGSFRDAMNLLEQAVSRGVPVTREAVEAVVSVGGLYEVDELIDRLEEKDVGRFLADLNKRREAGADASVISKRLVERLHEKLLALVGNKKSEAGSGIVEMARLGEVFLKAHGGIKKALIPFMPLEIAAVEWCLGGEAREGRQEVREIKASDTSPRYADSHGTAKPQPSKKSEHDETSNATAEPKTLNREKLKSEEVEKVVVKQSRPLATGGEVSVTLDEILQKWQAVLMAVKPLNHSLEALLKAARPLQLNRDELTLEVYYAFHKEQLEQERHRLVLEEVMAKVLEERVKLYFTLGKKVAREIRKSSKEVVNITGKVSDEELAKAAEEIFGN